MPDSPLTWIPVAPLLAAIVAALLLLAQNRKKLSSRYVPWLRVAALLSVVAGFVAEVTLLLTATGSASIEQLGIALAISTPARMVLVAANIALFCAAILAWTGEDAAYKPGPEWGLLLAALTSSLLAVAGLVDDRVVAALCLFGAALAASALAMARPRMPMPESTDRENIRAHMLLARRIAGGLKHMGMATIGTGLLVVGAVLVARYAFNLENRELLRLGLALLAVGIVVRAGSMPFSAPAADTIQAAPPAALMMLGAGTPVVLVVGLLMFAPIEGSLAGGAAAGWLGAIGTLLAGFRALGTQLEERQNPDEDIPPTTGTAAEANLMAMTVAAATGWAIFGILSGSHTGAVGAVLIAVNIALALPILLMGKQWMVLGVVSLLGLPPFGGFAGTILVAQSAANAGGLWLAVLLVGSGLVAAAWLSNMGREGQSTGGKSGWRDWLTDPSYLLPALLVILQLAYFVSSSQFISDLNQWATVPWLAAP